VNLRERLRLRSRLHGLRDALGDPNYEYVSRRSLRSDAVRLHLKWLLLDLGVNCVVDVGAHYGEFGSLLRHSGYRGRIVSFEPVAENFAHLEKAATTDVNWMVHPLALGRSEDSASINVTSSTAFSSLLAPNDFGRRAFPDSIGVDHVEEVQVRPLSDLWGTVTAGLDDPRAFLKMDTQGWDMEVLAGAEKILGDVIGIQSEVSVLPIYEDQEMDYRAVIDHLHGLGFELSGLFPVSWDPQIRVVEFDCVTVRTLLPDTGP
jgi:FkbM family methyltransferase